MLAEELRKKLIEEIKDNDLEHFFAMTQQYISESSELQNILLLLANRTRNLKMDSLKKIIDYDKKELERNKITNELIEVIGLISNEDLKKEKVTVNLQNLLHEINNRKLEFQKIIEDKGRGLMQIGQYLIKLGEILQEKPQPDDKIPYEEKIKIGAKKGARRIKIGFLELKELKNSMVAGLHKIAEGHEKLVGYLDFPKEEIGESQIEMVKVTVSDLEDFIKKINPEENVEQVQIKEAIKMFESIVPFKDQLGPTFESFFEAMDEVRVKCEETLGFLEKNKDEMIKAKSKLKTLFTELQLNIEESEF